MLYRDYLDQFVLSEHLWDSHMCPITVNAKIQFTIIESFWHYQTSDSNPHSSNVDGPMSLLPAGRPHVLVDPIGPIYSSPESKEFINQSSMPPGQPSEK